MLCEQLLPGHQAKSQTGSGTMQQVPLEALFCAALNEPDRGKHWLKTPCSLGEKCLLFLNTLSRKWQRSQYISQSHLGCPFMEPSLIHKALLQLYCCHLNTVFKQLQKGILLYASLHNPFKGNCIILLPHWPEGLASQEGRSTGSLVFQTSSILPLE